MSLLNEIMTGQPHLFAILEGELPRVSLSSLNLDMDDPQPGSYSKRGDSLQIFRGNVQVTVEGSKPSLVDFLWSVQYQEGDDSVGVEGGVSANVDSILSGLPSTERSVEKSVEDAINSALWKKERKIRDYLRDDG